MQIEQATYEQASMASCYGWWSATLIRTGTFHTAADIRGSSTSIPTLYQPTQVLNIVRYQWRMYTQGHVLLSNVNYPEFWQHVCMYLVHFARPYPLF